jgi:hypothetical protein
VDEMKKVKEVEMTQKKREEDTQPMKRTAPTWVVAVSICCIAGGIVCLVLAFVLSGSRVYAAGDSIFVDKAVMGYEYFSKETLFSGKECLIAPNESMYIMEVETVTYYGVSIHAPIDTAFHVNTASCGFVWVDPRQMR